jgi:hypothetical protein
MLPVFKIEEMKPRVASSGRCHKELVDIEVDQVTKCKCAQQKQTKPTL